MSRAAFLPTEAKATACRVSKAEERRTVTLWNSSFFAVPANFVRVKGEKGEENSATVRIHKGRRNICIPGRYVDTRTENDGGEDWTFSYGVTWRRGG